MMKTLSPDIQNLTDKLKVAEEIYEKASSRVHNRPMRDQLKLISKKKEEYLTELSVDMGTNLNTRNINLSERIHLELEKAEIEISHLLIRRNENDILSFCIQREQELVQSYLNGVIEAQKSNEKISILLRQLEETKRLLEELKETKKAYEFNEP